MLNVLGQINIQYNTIQYKQRTLSYFSAYLKLNFNFMYIRMSHIVKTRLLNYICLIRPQFALSFFLSNVHCGLSFSYVYLISYLPFDLSFNGAFIHWKFWIHKTIMSYFFIKMAFSTSIYKNWTSILFRQNVKFWLKK